jgi:hypothetical protein
MSNSISFWYDACIAARNRPLQAQLDSVYASCILTVGCAVASATDLAVASATTSLLLLLLLPPLLPFSCGLRRSLQAPYDSLILQVMAYCFSFVAAGTMFYLWWRLASSDRQRVWPLYGWFSLLMMCGSCVGILTWLAKVLSLVPNLNASDIIQDAALSNSSKLRVQKQVDLLFAESANWNAVFSVTYSVRERADV